MSRFFLLADLHRKESAKFLLLFISGQIIQIQHKYPVNIYESFLVIGKDEFMKFRLHLKKNASWTV